MHRELFLRPSIFLMHLHFFADQGSDVQRPWAQRRKHERSRRVAGLVAAIMEWRMPSLWRRGRVGHIILGLTIVIMDWRSGGGQASQICIVARCPGTLGPQANKTNRSQLAKVVLRLQ